LTACATKTERPPASTATARFCGRMTTLNSQAFGYRPDKICKHRFHRREPP